MEYLTLQDIPHRHCDQLHARKMTSTHSAERPLGNMVAAVSPNTNSPSFTTPASYMEPTMADPFRFYSTANTSRSNSGPPKLHHIRIKSLPAHMYETKSPRPLSGMRSHSYHPRQRSSSPWPRLSSDYTADQEAQNTTTSATSHSQYGTRPERYSSSTLTDSQNHHMRSSPPIQPGEQNFPGKLPSFSEVCRLSSVDVTPGNSKALTDQFLSTTRHTTPPRTPLRRDGSADSSPHAQPQFDEVAWTDSKRRRVDTLGDIYARSVTEQPVVESRRISNAIDPALVGYSPRHTQQHAVQALPPVHQHRPSQSYPPPQHQSGPLGPHVRHQSSPVPQGHMSYAQPPMHHPIPQSSYTPMVQHSAVYDSRPSYYHESQASAYGYDRPHDSYYARPPFPGYDNAYSDIRFQQHVGLDQNAFNRKRRGNLPKEATNMLKDWFQQNRTSPYPTEDQKMDLCNKTGLSLNQCNCQQIAACCRSVCKIAGLLASCKTYSCTEQLADSGQVSNWFINARRRAPQKEARERDANGSDM